MKCPKDKEVLEFKEHYHMSCSKCCGDFLTFPEGFQQIKERFHEVYRPKTFYCPSCDRKMNHLLHDQGGFYVECCQHCQGIWFDEYELEKLENLIKKLHKKVKWYKGKNAQKVISQEKIIYEKYQHHGGFEKKITFNKIIFQVIMNIPIEHNIPPFRFPLMTWSLVLANIAVLFYSIQHSGHFYLKEFAFYPTKPSLQSALTSFFSHAGIAHLFGNMYFLKILGDNVEDILGKTKFLTMYFLAGFLGVIPYYMTGESIPLVGASGAVAAVMGSYFVLFPKVKFNFRFLFIFHFNIPGWFLAFLYIGLQFLIGFNESNGSGRNIAWETHLAGFITGIMMAYSFKKSKLT